MKLPENMSEAVGDRLLDPGNNRWWRAGGITLMLLLLLDILLGWYWSREPSVRPVLPAAAAVTGSTTTEALIQVAETLLDKPGGYLSNDILPHRLWLDNMPNWEFGVLVQVRDMTRVMRRDMSRSQSQSEDDRDLMRAEPQFNFDNKSWAIPATEREYRRGIDALKRYQDRLQNGEARFFARADNLNYWLGDVHNRLGAMSQQLSQSVGRDLLSANGAAGAVEQRAKTPWMKIDDVFYEARGGCWALIHLLKAAEHDFADVLAKKNALISFRQVIQELEATQETVWSPMILNGSGFGVLANHSLVMANYISRANAALLDLRQLLSQG
ncbi:MAG: DUF2333 domain-containing protein [Gammaproteobacteria bacterium HGW-Gammaproteobacteria-14]|nr:MAG: DUF2333 domain-containing protein [Gammaproteobacteria bacterium HGW-Gammaproteobacteria-14]